MAYDINNCTFTGRLSGQPRFCTSANGVSYTRFYVRCVTNRYDSASGKYVDIPNIIPCVAFGDVARQIGRDVRHGTRVAVNGPMYQQIVPGRDGKAVNEFVCHVDSVEVFEDGKNGSFPPRDEWMASGWRR